MSRRTELRKRLHWRVERLDDRFVDSSWHRDWMDGLDHGAHVFVCAILGHDPIPDQCGFPAHDFCAWCQRAMPGQAADA